MILFRPSSDFLEVLFRYQKSRRENIKATTLEDVDIELVKESVGYTFRHGLVTFAFKITALPLRLCAIIEPGKPGFTTQLDKILRNYLKIGQDRESNQIMKMFAEDVVEWLKEIGGELKAEEKEWPYTRIYVLDDRKVIMDLNHTRITVSARSIH